MEEISFIASIFSLLQLDLQKNIPIFTVLVFIILILTYKLIINSIKYGLLDIFSQKGNFHKFDVILSKKIRKANEIKILLTTGARFFNNLRADLLSAIKDNNAESIKILIGTKDHVFLNDVKKIEDRADKNDINSEIDTVIGIIEGIRKEAGDLGNRIELKHFSTEFRASIILIDSGKEKWGKITLTLPPAKASDSMSFFIRGKIFYNKKADNIFEQCENHFNKIWSLY